MTAAPALELRGIVRRFGRVEALAGVDFDVAPGEVHALLGENGAGKSTLMHIAYGMLHPDAGEIRLHGVTHQVTSPRRARALGVGMVHQHFTSIPSLSVAENVALAAGWDVAPRALAVRVEALGIETGLPLDPAALVGDLSVSLKQRLEIVKALAADVRILLLDEPTAVLAPAEVDELLRMIRAYAARGNSAVLITHKLDEALAAADRVTVLRRGVVTRSAAARDESPASLAAAMIGGESPPVPESGAPVGAGGDRLIRVASLTVARAGGGSPALSEASMEVRSGEIVGVAGVEGNGQRELLRAIAGLVRPTSGTLETTGPVAFIPEDRTTEGLVGEMSLTENLVLGAGDGAPWISGRRIRWGVARARMASLIDAFGIRAPGPDAEARTLSGGNQQKVVVARALERAPKVIVAENPTRGLDIRAAREVHERLRRAAREGAAVIFSSGDLDEVLELATRIVVVANGRLAAAAAGAGRAEIGAAMLGRQA
ncbi:MAG: ABC transporter ATP-binding protein [Bacillota bacterium]